MKKYIYIMLALSLISCGSQGTSSFTGESGSEIVSIQATRAEQSNGSHTEGELLVKFRPGVTKSASSEIHRAARASVNKTFSIVPGLEQVSLPEGLSVSEAIQQYLSDPNVEYAEPNYLLYALSTAPKVPNDLYFERQWSLRNLGVIADGTPGADIQAVDAWGINTGSSGIVIAVIDTGIDYDHSDLVGNLWINPLEDPNNGIDDDLNGRIDDWRGWDFTTCGSFNPSPPFNCTAPKAESNDPFDDDGHGTHVSGTVGAVGNNGEGVAGVMWKVQIMPLKALNAQGVGSTADIINAIDYATANGAKIMNASLGGGGYSQAMFDAISGANNAGVLLVAAAGNESANNDINPLYPASYNLPNILSVAATDQNDLRISFSNFGITSVDVAAPGVYIFSTVPTWWANTPGFGVLEFSSGTSMAAPHVAGLAGLLYSQYPHFAVPEVRGTIMRYVDLLPSLQGWIASGGRINAYAALSSLLSPSGLTATATSSSEIALMWTDNAMGEDGYSVERSVSGGPFVMIADLGPDSESYVDNTVSPVNTYTYHVKAYNTIPASSGMIAAVVPAAPTSLSAGAVSTGTIRLNWSDNSGNETSFEIQRKKISQTIGGGEIEEGFTTIATVGANVTTYSDTGLLAATYVYRVRALTATGSSAFSNEASSSSTFRRSGSSSCSIGTRQNTPTALAGIAVLLLPLLFIVLMRRKGERG